ncbi:BTB (POZ) domain-containing protein 8 [Parelaphostrongylus tenuis]|uniref:BTB (POZ) domain-containing protein 8 n=1 Tax=Parelaphostrongylus tenuis TaxID=148309 RepID=A0AAD5R3R2_PARTN|nr:BTB (POZ) domain-containing protein 8 [Parelaphostrongylus tenuis]
MERKPFISYQSRKKYNEIALPRSKSESSLAVLLLVDDIFEVAMQFLVHSFHLVVTSQAFQQHGKVCESIQGLALNLGVLEQLLPSVVHSLSADVAIKAFKGLDNLLREIHTRPSSPTQALKIPVDDYVPRFCLLVRRIYELIDKHLLHYAALVVKSEAWPLLSDHQQARIQEAGLFVEILQPKAAPPRFSSHNRSYKRSASAGVHFSAEVNQERATSLERAKPLSIIEQTVRSSDEKSERTAVNEPVVERKRERKEESITPQENTEQEKTITLTSRTKLPSIATTTSKELRSASRSTSREKCDYTDTQEQQPVAISDDVKESASVRYYDLIIVYLTMLSEMQSLKQAINKPAFHTTGGT